MSALYKEMYRYIDKAVQLNVNTMFEEALRTTRIEMSEAEKKQFRRNTYELCRCSFLPKVK